MIPLGVLASSYVAPAGGGGGIDGFDWEWRFESDSITGLSNGDRVQTWPDTSGNSRDATQATELSRPTYTTGAFGSLPGVTFASLSDERLVTASITALSQPTTIWFVSALPAISGVYAFDGIASTARHGLFRSLSTPTLYAGSTGGFSQPTINIPAVHVARFATTSSAWWTNGSPIASGLSVGTHTLTGLTIGNRYTNASSLGTAIGAVLVINEAQSVADMNTVGNYLADKFGFTWTDIT